MSEKMRKALEPFAEFARFVAAEHPGWDHDQFNFGSARRTEREAVVAA